jgi:hypothetical protein
MLFTRVRSPSAQGRKKSGCATKLRKHHAKRKILDLAERLRNNDPNLHEVRLCGAKLGDLDAVAIAQSLKHNTIVTRVRLARNRIGDRGAKAFAWLLRENTTITVLNLRSNRICDSGANALGAVLKCTSTMKDLGLDFNYVSDHLRHEVDALSHVPGERRVADWADRVKQEEENKRQAETRAMGEAEEEDAWQNSVWRADDGAAIEALAERARREAEQEARAAEHRAKLEAKEKEERLAWERKEKARRAEAEQAWLDSAERARSEANWAYFGVLNLESPGTSRG